MVGIPNSADDDRQEVSNLIRTPEPNIATRISAIYNLDSKVTQWWSKLPLSFRLTTDNISTIPTGQFPKILLINTVYRQCLTALHASIIPLFSWSTEDDAWPTARRLSATIAFDHAREASDIFEAALGNYPDSSAFPSFVAYAAYSGCAIQIPFMWCREQKVRDRAYANVKTNARVIHTLATHWKFAGLLVSLLRFLLSDVRANLVEQEIHLRYIYKMHAKDPVWFENEPRYLDASHLSGVRIHGPRARDSILGHTRILWTPKGHFLKEGEETTDLSVEEDSPRTSADQSPQQAFSGAEARPDDHGGHLASMTAEFQQDPPNQQVPYVQFGNMGAQTGPRTDMYADQVQHFFNPFLDAEVLGTFPNGDLINFSELDTSPMSLNFLDGWAPGIDNNFSTV